jgi:hypothetical protein
MAEKIWTAAELEAMSPAERHELFEASKVLDLDAMEGDPLLERTWAKLAVMSAEADADAR